MSLFVSASGEKKVFFLCFHSSSLYETEGVYGLICSTQREVKHILTRSYSRSIIFCHFVKPFGVCDVGMRLTGCSNDSSVNLLAGSKQKLNMSTITAIPLMVLLSKFKYKWLYCHFSHIHSVQYTVKLNIP